MVLPKFGEEIVYEAVEAGELRIDPDGTIWRLGARRGDRWSGGTRLIPCQPRRAEHHAEDYLQVRVMTNQIRVYAQAHRLVWRHLNGPIPDGLTVNHKDGDKTNNHPSNLELATYSEQTKHARETLKRGRLDQHGTKNSMVKLSTEQAEEIRRRRDGGEKLKSIAADYGIAMQTVSKIARGDRRSHG